jgi:hypothetical protein
MTDPYKDLPEALYVQWERRWGSVAFLGVMIMSVMSGVGAIVMYEATSTVPYALGITGALCGIFAGVSMLTVAALRPRVADVSGVVGGGGTFILTAARQWAAAGWLWLAMVGLGLRWCRRFRRCSGGEWGGSSIGRRRTSFVGRK